MATGLMLIWIGKGTKKLHELQGLGKTYQTMIDFAKMSDTWDLDYWDEYEEYEERDMKMKKDGEKLRKVEGWSSVIKGILKNGERIKAPTVEAIQNKLDEICPVGVLPLTPFSAKKKNGKKLYELARKGEMIVEDEEMKIHRSEVLDYSFPELKLELEVGSWTYIRSIGYWLGQQFGLWGILTQLRRTVIWVYKIKDFEYQKIEGQIKEKDVEIWYAEVDV